MIERTVFKLVLIWACAVGWPVAACGQSRWTQPAKANSLATKSILLTYSPANGFYPIAVTRSSGAFLIHVVVRDRIATPNFHLLGATGAAMTQIATQKGKPLSVQSVVLNPGTYRLTVPGAKTPDCVITITK